MPTAKETCCSTISTSKSEAANSERQGDTLQVFQNSDVSKANADICRQEKATLKEKRKEGYMA